MDADLKAALQTDLGSGYKSIADPAGLQKRIFAGSLHATIHWIGPIAGSGNRVTVASSYYCGDLCAGGGTYVVSSQGGVWTVTGTIGGTWIS
jgi:hypothetical protein